jgi:LysM repeat protein
VITLYQYTIKPGDTLPGIANYYGLSTEAILAANPGLSEDNMPEGTVIIIPISTSRMILRKLLGR